MTLIVEDGTALASAESYISVVDASAYHLSRGNDTWAGLTDTQMEQALRRATDYMQEGYRGRWKGWRVTTTQALDWPRTWVERLDVPSGYASNPAYYPQNVIPEEVKRACSELALKAAGGDVLADQSQNVLSETIGPISIQYDKYSPQRSRYPAVDGLLRPFLCGGGANVSLVRA